VLRMPARSRLPPRLSRGRRRRAGLRDVPGERTGAIECGPLVWKKEGGMRGSRLKSNGGPEANGQTSRNPAHLLRNLGKSTNAPLRSARVRQVRPAREPGSHNRSHSWRRAHAVPTLGSGHERQRQAPARWPATLLPRWGAPGEDLAVRQRPDGKRGPRCFEPAGPMSKEP
jgi:hypothetical protein